jgi:DHA1 family tetracycline resistance protein-like MFS transporter
MGRRAAAMPFIMIVVLIDMLSIGIIVPVLPALVGQFTADPTEQTYWYGVVTFSFAVASFFGAPLLGALSDRFGRRKVLLIGFSGLALNFFATAMASALWMLIAARIVGGFTQANAAVANAYVADITPPEQRARRFGLLGAMFGIGFVLGPVLGGLLGDIDLRLPFWVAGVLTLLNFVYGVVVLPESLPPEQRRAVTWRAANPLLSLKALTQLRGIGPLVAVLALSALAQYMLYTTWVLHNSFKFGWGPSENGWSLFVVGVVAAVVQGGLMGRLLKHWAPWQLALMGMASSTLAFAGWGLATAGWVIYVIIVANVLGNTVVASMNSIVSSAADATEQGGTMGALSALNSAMAVFAPLLAAPLLGLVADLPQGDWHLGLPMFVCAALQATALVLAALHFRRSGIAREPHPSPAA